MERHPPTAVLITCTTCGLVRVADNYGSAHARGDAHVRLSGHLKIKYDLIEAPERLKGALLAAKASMEAMAVEAGVKDITIEASYGDVIVETDVEPDLSARR